MSFFPHAPMMDTSIRLTILARNLDAKDMGGFGKSDPFLVISLMGGNKPTMYHKTEVVMKNLNPQWKPFEVRISELGGWDKQLLFEVYDYDSDGSNDFIGKFHATMLEVKQKKKFDLINPKRKSSMFGKSTKVAGQLHITSFDESSVPPPIPTYAYNVTLRASKLDKKDFGSSDPFLLLYGGKSKDKKLLAKSEVIKKNISPTWAPIIFEMEGCGGEDGSITIEIYDWETSGLHDYIGKCQLVARDLSMKDSCFPVIDEHKEGGLTYTNSGTLHVVNCTKIPITAMAPRPAGFEFHMSANHIPKMDGLFGKADPFLIFSLLEGKGSKKTLTKTEVAPKTLSPVWKPFQLSLSQCQGLDTQLLIEAFDKDKKGQELIGVVKVTLRELTMTTIKDFYLVNPKKKGGVTYQHSGILHVNSVTPLAWIQQSGVHSAYSVRFAGKGLAKKDYGGLGKSDPFFLLIEGHAPLDGRGKAPKSTPLHKSNILQDNSNPVWENFTLDVGRCGGPDGKIRIEVYDFDSDGSHDLIGIVNLTARELTMSKTTPELALVDPKHKTKAVGVLQILEFTPTPTAILIDGAHQAGSMVMGAGGPQGAPQSMYGAPQPGPYGGPPQSMYGAPPGPYGGPPQSMYGAPPGPYGQPGAPQPYDARQGSMYPPQQPGPYGQPSPYGPPQGSMYPPQQPGPYGAPQGSMYPPQQPGPYGAPQGSMYPPQQGGYPPQQQQGGYPPQQQQGGYPPQQPIGTQSAPAGTPSEREGAPPPQSQSAGQYPPQQGGAPQGQYPPQQGGAPQGQYPPQQGGAPQGQYPPQQGGSPQGSMYPPQQGGAPQGQYPPQQGGAPQGSMYPPQQGGAPQGQYPPQQGGAPQGQYPPQQGGAPQGQYPPQQGGAPPK